MKLIFKINTNKLLFLMFVFLSFTLSEAMAQISGGNKCPYILNCTVKGVECLDDGSVVATIESGDASIIPNNHKMFKLVPQGEDPDDYLYTTKNTFIGLAAGTYTLFGTVFCESEGDYEPDIYISNIVVPVTTQYIQPTLLVVEQRKSLNCAPTGMVRVTPTVGGKGPFTLELTAAPAEYINSSQLPKIVYSENTMPAYLEFESLYPGKYKYRLTTGCEGSVAVDSTVIGQVSTDFYSSSYYNHFFTPQYNNNSNPTSNHLLFYPEYISFSNSTHELHPYWRQGASLASKFYEYAFYFPQKGETPAALAESAWKPIPTTYGILYEDPNYTIKEIREDQANKLPSIAMRVKGGTSSSCSYYTKSPILRDVDPYLTLHNKGCQDKSLYWYFGYYTSNIYGGILAYPYAWKITRTSDNVVVETSTDSVTHYYQTVTSKPYPPGTYRLTITDRQGTTWSDERTVSQPVNVTTYSYSYRHSSPCMRFDSIYPYLYPQSQSGGTLAGATIEFDRAATDSRIPAPRWWTPTNTSIQVPKDFGDDSYFPYAYYEKNKWGNYDMAGYCLYYTDWPYATPIYFNVTDSCGILKQVSVSHTYTTYEYSVETEPFEVVYRCGTAVVKFKNNKPYTMTPINPAGTSSLQPGYAQVQTKPSGATVTYANSSSEYISSGVDSLYLSKSGKYTIRTSNHYNYFYNNNGYCNTDFEVDINIPQLQVDKSSSAAYRCPSNNSKGYVYISATGGSGNYYYELFEKNNTSVHIDTPNTTGEFDGWGSNTTADTLTVRVTDLGCGSEVTTDIGLYDLNNETLLWVSGSSRRCIGDEVKLNARALGPRATYKWYFPNTTESDERTPVIGSASLDHSGKYKLEITIPGCDGEIVTRYLDLSVADRLMYWNPAAADNNWHNTDNWLIVEGTSINTAKAVPAPCTTVHIAGNSKNYPNLDKDYTPRVIGTEILGLPACDTIIYHYGSETIFPHYLQYSFAKVQYNFNYYGAYPYEGYPAYSAKDQATVANGGYPYYAQGATNTVPVMLRDRWYMVSSPLKHIVGGDFSMSGYPWMYQRLFNATNPQNNFTSHDSYTRPFHTLTQELSTTGNAMALYAGGYYNVGGPYIGWTDHKNMEALKGVVELPFYMNSNTAEHSARLHSYNSGQSKFQYYNKADLTPIADDYAYITRGYKGARFTYENDQDTVMFANDRDGVKVAMYHMPLPELPGGSATRRVMIGNPLMCHLDFDMLYLNNSDIISNNYWYNNTTTDGFLSYRSIPGETIDATMTNEIAPLQGFVVEILANPSRNYLIMPLEGDNSVVSIQGSSAQPKPRSQDISARSGGSPRKGWFTVTGVTPPEREGDGFVTDSVQVVSTLLFNYDYTNDVTKLVFPYNMDKKIETFFMNEEGNLNSDQVANNLPEVVKFGIESCYQGANGYLRFNKGGNLIKSAVLYDTKDGGRMDVTEGGYYRFTPKCDCVYDKTEGNYVKGGLAPDRFELHFTYYEGLGITDNQSDLSVSVNNNKELKILSSDELSSVEVLSVSGIRVLYADNISSTSYTHQLNVSEGTYIVKVSREGLKQELRKIVIR
ncbi:T9SS type A sorting domain-containing protein [Dysgonomonas sp. 216]|uniref:T9SS type A sorting domain-containing protein n=1 Tax=Dysgonomonas sp. 216 TaxID=2302934 RepID=UPI0013D16270|nr:T9SS type A sorting domain-containing protein [Dysgonomonas sp. 216]